MNAPSISCVSTAGRVGFQLVVFFLLIELAIGVMVRRSASIPVISQNMTVVRLGGRILGVNRISYPTWE